MERLDPGSRVTAQQEGESVSNFVQRLERTFHVAYGQDRMSSETKEAILYGQLQEGLPLEFFRGPAVLGALGYKEFCVVAAKGKERRLSKLKKRQAYLHQGNSQAGNIPKPTTTNQSPVKRAENG